MWPRSARCRRQRIEALGRPVYAMGAVSCLGPHGFRTAATYLANVAAIGALHGFQMGRLYDEALRRQAAQQHVGVAEVAPMLLAQQRAVVAEFARMILAQQRRSVAEVAQMFLARDLHRSSPECPRTSSGKTWRGFHAQRATAPPMNLPALLSRMRGTTEVMGARPSDAKGTVVMIAGGQNSGQG